MTMRVKFEGKTYQFGPELWADMNLPRDCSWWAKSVRWSCGRPGFTMPSLRFDHEQAYLGAMAVERAFAFASAQILRADGAGFLKITGS